MTLDLPYEPDFAFSLFCPNTPRPFIFTPKITKKLKLKLNQRLKFYVFPVISQQQEYDDMKYIRYISTRNLTIILYLTRIPSFLFVLTLIYMCTYSCGNTRSCFEWWSLYFRLARSTPCGILATEGNIVNKCSYHEQIPIPWTDTHTMKIYPNSFFEQLRLICTCLYTPGADPEIFQREVWEGKERDWCERFTL